MQAINYYNYPRIPSVSPYLFILRVRRKQERNDLNAVAVAFGETRRKLRKRGTEVFGGNLEPRNDTKLHEKIFVV